jgi:hypothetical protein
MGGPPLGRAGVPLMNAHSAIRPAATPISSSPHTELFLHRNILTIAFRAQNHPLTGQPRWRIIIHMSRRNPRNANPVAIAALTKGWGPG